MNAPETPFSDHCAIVRGLQIAQERAPIFSQHLQAERQRMEKVADETIAQGFLASGRAMKEFIRDL